MAVEFQEYKAKQRPVNRTHKFPLIRLILVALAAFLAYWSGLASRIVDALPLPGNEDDVPQETWDVPCARWGGAAFLLQNDMVQCSWLIDDSLKIENLPNAFLRYTASLRKGFKSKLHWIAPVKDFSNAALVIHEDVEKSVYLHYQKEDSSYVWISKGNGCKFPGVCPKQPLEWSAYSISDGFDFEGQESLLAMDVFWGIGEAPIYPVLSGKVLDKGKDSLGYFIELDHGYNVSSRTAGMGALNESLSIGDWVSTETTLGRLLAKDQAAFFLAVRLNGQFVRWEDFYAQTHPAEEKAISAFENQLGF